MNEKLGCRDLILLEGFSEDRLPAREQYTRGPPDACVVFHCLLFSPSLMLQVSLGKLPVFCQAEMKFEVRDRLTGAFMFQFPLYLDYFVYLVSAE